VQTALHAAVAHPGLNIGHFCEISDNLFRKRLLFIMRGLDREKVLDPWPPVMQTSKGLASKGLALSRHEPSRRTVVRLAEPLPRTFNLLENSNNTESWCRHLNAIQNYAR
jgi:hypothetical protein